MTVVESNIQTRELGADRLSHWQASATEWLRRVGFPVSWPSPSHHSTAATEIGVIGMSGMGKSTLVNALVAPGCQLLPAGGISPLTGCATRIELGAETELTVQYLSKAWLHDVLRSLKAEQLSDEHRGRLALACTGDQYRRREGDWLLLALQHALNPDSRIPPDEQPETRAALARLSVALRRLGERQSWRLTLAPEAFFAAMREHTCGQYAPLCQRISLCVDAPFLHSGLALVDLPGVGSVRDSHASLTHTFLTTARAVLLVVDRAGLGDPVVEALVRTGFVDRWLNGQAELLIAVTKLDLVANDARRADRQLRSWMHHFFEATAGVRSRLRQQVMAALDRSGDRPKRPIHIIPVSADEMHRQASVDDEAAPRLRTSEGTGVPELRRALVATARKAATPWANQVDQTIANILGESIRQDWLMLLEEEGDV